MFFVRARERSRKAGKTVDIATVEMSKFVRVSRRCAFAQGLRAQSGRVRCDVREEMVQKLRAL